jgi:hypothetical protein
VKKFLQTVLLSQLNKNMLEPITNYDEQLPLKKADLDEKY